MKSSILKTRHLIKCHQSDWYGFYTFEAQFFVTFFLLSFPKFNFHRREIKHQISLLLNVAEMLKLIKNEHVHF